MSTSPSATAAAAAPGSPHPPAATEPATGPIAPDPAIEDDNWTDADTESLRTSSTASLSESITEYRRILGRTYTQKIDYCLPNDEKQNEGLEVAHYWETLFLGDKLFLAPIGPDPQKVLDIGTGTGIWAIDFADEFPSAEVLGVDISPIQPGWVPPNCKFQIDDVEQDWTYPTDHFDFVHIRHLEAAISDWGKMYQQAFEHLQPGGFIEIKHFDIEDHAQALGPLPETHVYKRWAKAMEQSSRKLGKSIFDPVRDHGIAKDLGQAGFVDIVEKAWQIPIGGWPKDPMLREVGACNLQFIDQSLEGFGYYLLKEVLDWETPEVIVFIAEMRKALRDPKLQSYFALHLVYARKPEAEKAE